MDTEAHVSVLPKQLTTETISLPEEGYAKRHVKAFGGEEIVLDGPVLLDIIICGVHIVHPFFYVDAEIPAIGGYDLLRAAHIIIDTQSAEVCSNHPDAVNQSCISENIFATEIRTSCVKTDTTSRIPLDTRPAVPDDESYSTFRQTFCVTASMFILLHRTSSEIRQLNTLNRTDKPEQFSN